MKKPKPRRCGDCRECCFVLGVEPVQKPPQQHCQHECARGCAIYEKRPNSCAEFTCLWLAGMLPKSAKPSKTHMVVYGTALGSTMRHTRLEVVQCDIRGDAPMHPATWQWLVDASHKVPVVVCRNADTSTLYQYGKKLITWTDDEHVRFDLYGKRLANLRAEPATPENDAAIKASLAANMVQEVEPEYRAAMTDKEWRQIYEAARGSTQ